MSLLRKNIIAKVSSSNGTFVKNLTNFQFQGFTKTINGGIGECVIRYNVAFDYNGAELTLFNDVEIYISDDETLANTSNNFMPPSGTRLIYKGYISLVERDMDNKNELVTVHLVGYYTLLALAVLKNSAQTTLYSNSSTGLTTSSGSNNAADIGLMTRAVMDRFAAEVGTKVFYAAADVPNTSTTAKYIFTQKTYREALDFLKSLAPANTYWYVDETGKLTFKPIPTTPTHRFIFGRHFSKVHVEKSVEKVRNTVYVFNGATSSGIYYHYEDAASIAVYGRRVERITDFGITDTGAAAAIGAKFLAENKDPAIKLVVTIFDSNNDKGLGYDIETINPGDTCTITAYSSNLSDIFLDNMLITAVNYTLDSVELTVELTQTSLINSQQQLDIAVASINSAGYAIPASYS